MFQNEINIKHLIQEISERDEEIKKYKAHNVFKSNYLDVENKNKYNYSNKMNKVQVNKSEELSDYENAGTQGKTVFRQTDSGTNYNYNYNGESNRNMTIYDSVDLENVNTYNNNNNINEKSNEKIKFGSSQSSMGKYLLIKYLEYFKNDDTYKDNHKKCIKNSSNKIYKTDEY